MMMAVKTFYKLLRDAVLFDFLGKLSTLQFDSSDRNHL